MNNLISFCCNAPVLMSIDQNGLPEKPHCSCCFQPCKVRTTDWHFDLKSKPNEKDMEKI